MSYILGLDESQWQGGGKDYNQVKAAGYEFTVPRMTYAYPGQAIKIDPTASANYYGAKAAGLVSGGYHKIGWTDPIQEADAYVNAMSPLAENDILAYDIEPNSDVVVPANWATWEQQFVQRIVDRTHTNPWRYLDISMWDSMPAQGVVANCTPWVAAPSYGWNDTVPVSVNVAVQQGPTTHIPGIPANVVDTDAFFGSMDNLLATTFHAAQPAPTPPPTPAPPVVTPVAVVTPIVTPIVTPVVTPIVTPMVTPVVTLTPVIVTPTVTQESGTVLPHLTNNVPPAPITTQTPTKTNTPIDSGVSSTLHTNTSQNSTSHKSLNLSWWARLWNFIKEIF